MVRPEFLFSIYKCCFFARSSSIYYYIYISGFSRTNLGFVTATGLEVAPSSMFYGHNFIEQHRPGRRRVGIYSASAGVGICLANLAKDQIFL